MDAMSQDGNKRHYTTPQRVQVWFLGRSRDNWKSKYKRLKAEAQRLKNRVKYAEHSREDWQERLEKLEAENAALREQAALKKDGQREGADLGDTGPIAVR
jgi:predicted nuclease with TOPRIM domain